jgi:hypothetical protein
MKKTGNPRKVPPKLKKKLKPASNFIDITHLGGA